MELKVSLAIIVLMTFVGRSSSAGPLGLIRNVLQNNIAGVPIIHQNTEWDFDPQQGKERRARFESLNGKYGQDLINRLGMGTGFDGPWGSKVSNVQQPNLRYV